MTGTVSGTATEYRYDGRGKARTMADSPLRKVCTKCKIEKPVRDFPKSKRHRLGVFSWCWDCWRVHHNVHQKKYKNSPLGKATVANNRFKKLYGITREQVSNLAREQLGRCAICNGIPVARNMHVDHDHVTGKVRGLLCQGCNQAVGQFKDDREVMHRAIAYLAKYS